MHWPWDVDIDTTRPALERCMRALLLTGSTLTDSMRPRFELGRGVSALLRIHVPEGEHDRFRDLCRPIEMRPPPQISTGMDAVQDDGHPGREQQARRAPGGE